MVSPLLSSPAATSRTAWPARERRGENAPELIQTGPQPPESSRRPRIEPPPRIGDVLRNSFLSASRLERERSVREWRCGNVAESKPVMGMNGNAAARIVEL